MTQICLKMQIVKSSLYIIIFRFMPMFKQTLHTKDYNCFDFPEKVMRSFCLSAYVYVIYVLQYILHIYYIEIAEYNLPTTLVS